ncbi:MAG: hypothetical protein QME05_06130 [Candidatus Margulisbacteria bacterium]|nr:hypothetical protein [Candidatus Margulisiibacteriota bacterium]
MNVTAETIGFARARLQAWADQQRRLKTKKPQHRVVIDVCMERVCTPSPAQLALRIAGAEGLTSLDAMRRLDMARVWEELQAEGVYPIGGAGGLGIIAETLGWTTARYGEAGDFGMLCLSILHDQRRVQEFKDRRQALRFETTEPESNGATTFEPLGEMGKICLHGEDRAFYGWLHTGYQGAASPIDIRLSVPGTTGIIYPPNYSQLNFDQMQVLGAAGFEVAKQLGLLGVDNPLADLVIGHDGHSALFKFQLFLHFYKLYNDASKAIEATKKLCVATIHAPQNGTVPRTTGDMVQKHYPQREEQLWGLLGAHPGQLTNALFADLRLSGRVGVVSPLHLMVTQAEETARTRGFANATELLPIEVKQDRLEVFPDTLDIESWLGMGVVWVLDQYCAGWRERIFNLGEMEQGDALRENQAFRKALAEAFEIQRQHLFALLRSHYPRMFKIDLPDDAVYLASLRRATSYKIDMITGFLRQSEHIERLAQAIGRPIVYLFGGIAHQDDFASIGSLEALLNEVDRINNRQGRFTAEFLLGHDYPKARWLFPGLARNGCWVGWTNPIAANRSQATEAFGPSYMKAVMNGMYVLGPDDGGSSCLRELPTVFVYGPTMHIAGRSLHNDVWGNDQWLRMALTILANEVLRGVERAAKAITADLARFEQGRGHLAPGLDGKIAAMLHVMSRYNGRVLVESYLGRTRQNG